MKLKLGISACLMGKAVRYDGGHKLEKLAVDVLGRHFELVAVCPETGCGMTVPRETMRLEGDPVSFRLVTTNGRVDKTRQMERWMKAHLVKLENENLVGFVLKSKSPSCGLAVNVYDSRGGVAGKTMGLFARGFTRRFPSLPVAEAEALSDAVFRESFIARLLQRT